MLAESRSLRRKLVRHPVKSSRPNSIKMLLALIYILVLWSARRHKSDTCAHRNDRSAPRSRHQRLPRLGALAERTGQASMEGLQALTCPPAFSHDQDPIPTWFQFRASTRDRIICRNPTPSSSMAYRALFSAVPPRLVERGDDRATFALPAAYRGDRECLRSFVREQRPQSRLRRS
jgi:hypothetical protein